MRESEIIAEAERLLAGSQVADDDGYVTRNDMRKQGFTEYAIDKALMALSNAGMLDTKDVLRSTRANRIQPYPGYKLKIAPQNA
jgi:hypothetical protein